MTGYSPLKNKQILLSPLESKDVYTEFFLTFDNEIITDPIWSFEAGTLIRIPKKSILQEFYNV